jgi:hypothetical protein
LAGNITAKFGRLQLVLGALRLQAGHLAGIESVKLIFSAKQAINIPYAE